MTFVRAEGCSAWERSVLMRSAHATAHVNSGWYRVWPPYDCGSTCGPRSTLEKDAGLRALHERTASSLAKNLDVPAEVRSDGRASAGGRRGVPRLRCLDYVSDPSPQRRCLSLNSVTCSYVHCAAAHPGAAAS